MDESIPQNVPLTNDKKVTQSNRVDAQHEPGISRSWLKYLGLIPMLTSAQTDNVVWFGSLSEKWL